MTIPFMFIDRLVRLHPEPSYEKWELHGMVIAELWQAGLKVWFDQYTPEAIRSIDEEIGRLPQARALLNSSGKATGKGRGPRTMSAAARARIAAAQRARWARVKAQKKK